MTSARKIKLKVTAPKPRNPLVVPLMQRKAGSHAKPESAKRRAEKMALKNLLRGDQADR